MSTQAIQAGEAFVNLSIKQDEFNKSITQISSKLEDIGKNTNALVGLMNRSLSNAVKSWNPLGNIITLTGVSISGLNVTFQNLSSYFKKSSKNIEKLSFALLQSEAAAKLNNIVSSKSILIQAGITATSYAWASAQWLVNAAIYACPIGWLVTGLALVGGAIAGALYYFGAFNDKLADHSKAMEDVRKRNESYLTSARSSLSTLQELSNIDPWQSDKKSVNLTAWNDLQRTTEKLGISLNGLGLSFDEQTGKLDLLDKSIKDPTEKTEALAKATAKLKEAMRLKELDDLNTSIQAQEKHLDDLHSKLDKNGKVGLGRWIGTYVTLGYMDNAEEIQKKIDEESQKFQENQDKRKTVVDFSAEYKENEAKLKEMYDKEAEASKNALAVKIDNIKTEFSEREAILRQLIFEAEARKTAVGLSKEESANLEARKNALAGLNAEQEERIRLLREEQAAKYQKIQDDYEAKKAENEENKSWNQSLEADPIKAKERADSEFSEAESAFNKAIEAAKAINENTSKEEIDRLNAEVERTRKESEKWLARREEAAKKVADVEKKAAEDAKKAAEEQAKAEEKAAQERLKAAEEERKTRESRFQQIEDLRTGKQEERDKKAEQEAWKKEVQDDPTSARETAQQQLDNLKANSDMEYYKLQQLAQSGSDEDYQAQLAAVRKMEESIDLWQSRLDESSMKEMENLKDNTEAVSQNVTRPDVLLSGSVDTQKKFLELQQATKNPLEEKMDESNRLLRRVAESSENLEGQMEAV